MILNLDPSHECGDSHSQLSGTSDGSIHAPAMTSLMAAAISAAVGFMAGWSGWAGLLALSFLRASEARNRVGIFSGPNGQDCRDSAYRDSLRSKERRGWSRSPGRPNPGQFDQNRSPRFCRDSKKIYKVR